MNFEIIEIQEEFIRLDNLLKFGGITSTGGQAKFLIQGGSVLVNDEICTQRGKKMRNGDKATYNGKILEVLQVESP